MKILEEKHFHNSGVGRTRHETQEPKRKRVALFEQHQNLTFHYDKRPVTGREKNGPQPEHTHSPLEKWANARHGHVTKDGENGQSSYILSSHSVV